MFFTEKTKQYRFFMFSYDNNKTGQDDVCSEEMSQF